VKDTLFSVKKTLNIKGKLYPLDKPRIMGIVNLTPDSFYAESRVGKEKELLRLVGEMLNDGADFIDLGGYSSRPGANKISEEEEQARVIPAIRSVVKSFPEILISVDTFRSSVARQAYYEGAVIINDISGGQLDDNMFRTIAETGLTYVLMHMRGDPQTMSSLTSYDNLFKEMGLFFNERVSELNNSGVSDIILDPGFGFSKSLDQNYELLKNLTYFEVIGNPLLVGLSRKSMIFKLLDVQPSEALNGTTILNTLALIKKASILRVHDIREAVQAVKILEKLDL
jgi:dihydropteroate synthase